MSKILEALRKLDPNNDNHWTADGLPKMETVTFLAGDSSITRHQVTETAPGFSRANLAALSPERTGEAMKASDTFVPSQDGPLVKTELGVVNNDGDLKADGSSPDTNAESETGAKSSEPEMRTEAGRDAKSWKEHLLSTIHDRESAQAAFDQARDAHNQATAALSATQAVLDRYIEEDAKSNPNTPLADALNGYFARQQAEREERAQRKAQLKDIPLKDILPKNSPLDDAMRRKNTRGTGRPTRI